jgi:mannan endo-1,4-beta-mannosidase
VPLAGKVVAPRAGAVYWGAFREGLPDRSPLVALERRVERLPAIAMWYAPWYGRPAFPRQQAEWLRERGIVPMLTWEPWRPPKVLGKLVPNQPRYRLARIAGGSFDGYLHRFARQVKAYGGPLMLRPFHEMDGFWYPWGGLANGNTPLDFVRAWRHVHRIFDAEGATNVTWVWSVNALSVPQTPSNSIAHYWPGARYVDWIGVSGFNWGSSSSFATWSTFGRIYGDRMRSLAGFHKPIALTEIASAEVGGDKAAWISATFASILHDYPRIRALVWYDKRDSKLRDWRIASSRPAAAAFTRAIAARGVLSAPAALSSARAHH